MRRMFVLLAVFMVVSPASLISMETLNPIKDRNEPGLCLQGKDTSSDQIISGNQKEDYTEKPAQAQQNNEQKRLEDILVINSSLTSPDKTRKEEIRPEPEPEPEEDFFHISHSIEKTFPQPTIPDILRIILNYLDSRSLIRFSTSSARCHHLVCWWAHDKNRKEDILPWSRQSVQESDRFLNPIVLKYFNVRFRELLGLYANIKRDGWLKEDWEHLQWLHRKLSNVPGLHPWDFPLSYAYLLFDDLYATCEQTGVIGRAISSMYSIRVLPYCERLLKQSRAQAEALFRASQGVSQQLVPPKQEERRDELVTNEFVVYLHYITYVRPSSDQLLRGIDFLKSRHAKNFLIQCVHPALHHLKATPNLSEAPVFAFTWMQIMELDPAPTLKQLTLAKSSGEVATNYHCLACVYGRLAEVYERRKYILNAIEAYCLQGESYRRLNLDKSAIVSYQLALGLQKYYKIPSTLCVL